MTPIAQVHDTTLTIRQTINAPRQAVFEAWTQPEHLQHWWRSSSQWDTPVAEIDLRVGGQYRLGMRDTDKDETYVCGGAFQEVVTNEKLVYTWTWEHEDSESGETLVTVEFHEREGATEVVLTHERFPTTSAAEMHGEGWCGCIENLTTHISAAAAGHNG